MVKTILIEGGHSLVVESGGEVRTFDGRGVADIFELYSIDRDFLHGARLADKVVGAGAAAIMAASGIKELHAVVISTKAKELLERSGVKVTCDKEVPNIINRSGDGVCPLEWRTRELSEVDEIVEEVITFVKELKNNANKINTTI